MAGPLRQRGAGPLRSRHGRCADSPRPRPCGTADVRLKDPTARTGTARSSRRRPMSPVGRVDGELDAPEAVDPVGVVAPVVVEGAHAAALGAQQLGVHVGDRPALPLGEALGLGEQDAVLVDHRLAVPGQVGGRLALAGRGVDVGGQTPRRRRPGHQLAVVGAADRDGAAGQVGEHRRAGQRGLGARRHRAPTCPRRSRRAARSSGRSVAANSRSGRTAPRSSPTPDGAALVVAGRDLPALVELAVGRQVRLRRDAEHCPAVDDDRGVVDPVAVPQRRTDHQHGQQVGRRGDDVGDGAPRPRRAGCPAAGCPRSSTPTASARGRPRARRRRRGTRAASRSTDSALAAGSANVVWCVHAATRTKPCR